MSFGYINFCGLPNRYITPGPLWWVFDHESARGQNDQFLHPGAVPEQPQKWQPKDGNVLLIDEIDRADADLPNGLLNG